MATLSSDGLQCIQWGSVNAPTASFNLNSLSVSQGVYEPSSPYLNNAISKYRLQINKGK